MGEEGARVPNIYTIFRTLTPSQYKAMLLGLITETVLGMFIKSQNFHHKPHGSLNLQKLPQHWDIFMHPRGVTALYSQVYIVYCVLYTVYNELCTVFCVLYTVYSTQYTVLFTVFCALLHC